MTKTWVEISRSALVANAASLRRVVGRKVKLVAAVKANAYGHGLPETVSALSAKGGSASGGKRAVVDGYAVDSLDEALIVRKVDAKRMVLIMGYVPLERLPEAVRKGFNLTVYNRETISALSRSAKKKTPARIHIKIETGTSRQGVALEDLPAFLRHLQRFPHIIVEGISTHYANIEDTSNPSYAQLQRQRFLEAEKIMASFGIRPKLRHTAASAAVLLYPETHMTMARTGISLYGLWPSEGVRRAASRKHKKLKLQPALAWKTLVAQVKHVRKGTPVSYGLTEKVKKDSLVAVLPVGYWDGYGRTLSSRGEVLIRGKRAKVLGRVCMNMCMVDVSGIPDVAIEDEVVLLGRQGKDEISAEELAAKAGAINYEIVTRINPMIERRIIN